jgi:hypothetical protein
MRKVTGDFRECGKAPKTYVEHMDACLGRTVLMCVRVYDEQTAMDTHRSLQSYFYSA